MHILSSNCIMDVIETDLKCDLSTFPFIGHFNESERNEKKNEILTKHLQPWVYHVKASFNPVASMRKKV